jgi:hypothetical protein
MPDPSLTEPSPTLTRNQAILIASRLFAAYLLFWVVSDLIDLPRQAMDVVHLIKQGIEMGMSLVGAVTTSFTMDRYMLYLLAAVLKMALWLLAAGWFYRCGPRIQAFFGSDEAPQNPPPSEP